MCSRVYRTITAALAAATLSLTLSREVEAQQYILAAAADVLAGIEGGSGGYASGIRRSRTTMRLGAELYIDEFPRNILGFAALVEVEPVASIGADLRYLRKFGESFYLNAGLLAVIAPKHMFGASFGMAYQIPIADDFGVDVGPTGNVFFAGADLPDSTVLWQAQLQAGVRWNLGAL